MAKQRPKLTDVLKTAEQSASKQSESVTESKRGRPPKTEAKRNKWIQLNIFVPEELRDKLKMQALKEKRDMSDIVVELLQSHLTD